MSFGKPWFQKKKKDRKTAPKEKDETKVLIGKLDDIFSHWIRLSDCDKNGMLKCATCNHFDHWTKFDNGHFMSRRHMATRFERMNCNPQCGGCNNPMMGVEVSSMNTPFTLISDGGDGTALKMKVLSGTTKHWFPFELRAMITYYKSEVKRLKGGKVWNMKKYLELREYLTTIPEDRQKKLQEAIDARFGHGYFGLHAGITFESQPDGSKYQYHVIFSNFNSVSGWATVGALRWDEKKGKYIINFRGPGLGRTGRYS